MNFQQHFQHLLPILDNLNPDTTDGDGADLFDLDNIQQPLADLPPPEEEPTPPLTELSFISGRKGGRQATYNGFVYTKDRTHASGTTSWQCKDRKLYNPACKGRLNTLGDTVSNERPHCHDPSSTKVIRADFISRVKRNNTNERPADVIRAALPSVPDDVKASLPKMDSMKK